MTQGSEDADYWMVSFARDPEFCNNTHLGEKERGNLLRIRHLLYGGDCLQDKFGDLSGIRANALCLLYGLAAGTVQATASWNGNGQRVFQVRCILSCSMTGAGDKIPLISCLFSGNHKPRKEQYLVFQRKECKNGGMN